MNSSIYVNFSDMNISQNITTMRPIANLNNCFCVMANYDFVFLANFIIAIILFANLYNKDDKNRAKIELISVFTFFVVNATFFTVNFFAEPIARAIYLL